MKICRSLDIDLQCEVYELASITRISIYTSCDFVFGYEIALKP